MIDLPSPSAVPTWWILWSKCYPSPEVAASCNAPVARIATRTWFDARRFGAMELGILEERIAWRDTQEPQVNEEKEESKCKKST